MHAEKVLFGFPKFFLLLMFLLGSPFSYWVIFPPLKSWVLSGPLPIQRLFRLSRRLKVCPSAHCPACFWLESVFLCTKSPINCGLMSASSLLLLSPLDSTRFLSLHGGFFSPAFFLISPFPIFFIAEPGSPLPPKEVVKLLRHCPFFPRLSFFFFERPPVQQWFSPFLHLSPLFCFQVCIRGRLFFSDPFFRPRFSHHFD